MRQHKPAHLHICCWKTVEFYARTTCLSLFGFCDCGSIRRKVDSFWNARFLKLWIRYQLALRNSPKITFGKIVCSPFFSVKIYCLEYPQRGQPHRLVKVVSVNTVHGCPWNRRSLLTKFGGPKNMDQLIKAPNYPILCYHGTTSSNWFLFANWLSPEHSKFPASCIPKTPACTQLINHKK